MTEGRALAVASRVRSHFFFEKKKRTFLPGGGACGPRCAWRAMPPGSCRAPAAPCAVLQAPREALAHTRAPAWRANKKNLKGQKKPEAPWLPAHSARWGGAASRRCAPRAASRACWPKVRAPRSARRTSPARALPSKTNKRMGKPGKARTGQVPPPPPDQLLSRRLPPPAALQRPAPPPRSPTPSLPPLPSRRPSPSWRTVGGRVVLEGPGQGQASARACFRAPRPNRRSRPRALFQTPGARSHVLLPVRADQQGHRLHHQGWVMDGRLSAARRATQRA